MKRVWRYLRALEDILEKVALETFEEYTKVEIYTAKGEIELTVYVDGGVELKILGDGTDVNNILSLLGRREVSE